MNLDETIEKYQDLLPKILIGNFILTTIQI